MIRTYTCQFCERSWQAESKPGQPPRYCSKECHLAKRRALGRERSANKPPKPPLPKRICANEKCGKPYTPSGRGKPQRFCSKRCGAGCYEMRTFICQFCGESWEAESRPGQPPRYCSEEHRKQAAVERATAWQKDNPDRNKEHKAKSFAKWARKNPDKIAALHAARYARTRGAPESENFSLDEILRARPGMVLSLPRGLPARPGIDGPRCPRIATTQRSAYQGERKTGPQVL